MSAIAPIQAPPPAFLPLTVSWNLTKLCNLQCAHCYLDAGPRADRNGELDAAESIAVLEQIAEVNPQAVLILTGGEPLLRKDIFALIRAASDTGFWTVLGSHGGMLDDAIAAKLIDAGLKGVGVSLDSTDAERHNRFRGIAHAWENTVAAMQRMRQHQLPFLIETTVTRFNMHELPAIAALAIDRGATALNVFFLVPTGRGADLNDLRPQEQETVLAELAELQQRYAGQLMINAKCAPHYRRVLWQRDHDSPFVRTFSGGGCPAGTYYCRITPDGDLTPCPYMPLSVGNLRETPFHQLWQHSPVLLELRQAQRSGRCGACEFAGLCGGCRCRAYASSGDYLAEDPSCTYQPGQHSEAAIPLPPERTYGTDIQGELPWTEGARARMQAIPSFARGMVRHAVEKAARRGNAAVITETLLSQMRKNMQARFPMRGGQ